MSFTWQGRRLATASANGKSLSFKYNSDGIRTQKTVNGVTTYFTLDGSKIISQKKGDQEIFFEYDATGNVATMIYNGNTYYYVRNLMGEIIGLVDDDGVLVGRYYYDPWGEITGYDSFTSQNIAFVNPFRYKGYYYDSELGFYYLNSRYYDPETSRFINADSVDISTATPMSLTDKNLFAYCDNNPIMRADHGGEFWNVIVGAAIGAAVSMVSSIVSEIISSDEFGWKEIGKVAVSTLIGAAEGAAIALCPAASVAISAGASMLDTAICGAIDRDSIGTIAINSAISAGFGAISGSAGSGFVKGGKLLNEAGETIGKIIKKGINPTVKK